MMRRFIEDLSFVREPYGPQLISGRDYALLLALPLTNATAKDILDRVNQA